MQCPILPFREIITTLQAVVVRQFVPSLIFKVTANLFSVTRRIREIHLYVGSQRELLLFPFTSFAMLLNLFDKILSKIEIFFLDVF